MLCDVTTTVTHEGGLVVATVSVVGEIDLAGLPSFRAALRSAASAAHDEAVVDLRDCTFLDSAGLGVLLGFARRRRGRPWSVLAEGSPLALITEFGVAPLLGLVTTGPAPRRRRRKLRVMTTDSVSAAETQPDPAGPNGPRSSTVTLSIPPRRELVALARGVVAQVARLHGIHPERVEDIRLIVSEAVTNALQAYLRRGRRRSAGSDRIEIRLDAVAGRFEITVRDSYGGPDAPLERPFAAPTSASATGGFGLPIMDSLSDELWVREIGGGLEIRAVILDRWPS